MQDLLLDATGDVAITAGDLAIGESNEQQQRLLLATTPGEWKAAPIRGVGVIGYLECPDNGQLARRIQTEFTADGMRVERINIDNNGTIDITAAYDNI